MTQKDDDSMSLADHIRKAADESGLSVYRIANDAQVDQSLLNKFMTGSRPNLRLDIADRLFRFLGLRVVSKRARSRKPPQSPEMPASASNQPGPTAPISSVPNSRLR